MDRDEAYEQMNVVVDECLEQEGVNVIDFIYDDFESRTCENCGWYNIKKSDDEGYCTMLENWYVDDFGCNEFKRKPDVNV